jgi:hypothetical protein
MSRSSRRSGPGSRKVVWWTDARPVRGTSSWRLRPRRATSALAGVLFFCDFGCATWSLLDRRHPQGQMWWWNMGERDKLALTLPQWLTAWLEGRIDVVRYSSTLVLADEAWSRPDD